jgi:hypothetical protein
LAALLSRLVLAALVTAALLMIALVAATLLAAASWLLILLARLLLAALVRIVRLVHAFSPLFSLPEPTLVSDARSATASSGSAAFYVK